MSAPLWDEVAYRVATRDCGGRCVGMAMNHWCDRCVLAAAQLDAATMGNVAIRITADLETALAEARERNSKLESEVYLMHHVTPIKRFRKRGKR